MGVMVMQFAAVPRQMAAASFAVSGAKKGQWIASAEHSTQTNDGLRGENVSLEFMSALWRQWAGRKSYLDWPMFEPNGGYMMMRVAMGLIQGDAYGTEAEDRQKGPTLKHGWRIDWLIIDHGERAEKGPGWWPWSWNCKIEATWIINNTHIDFHCVVEVRIWNPLKPIFRSVSMMMMIK